jgi:excisionase family DNA binding protein
MSMIADKIHFPRPSNDKKLTSFDWTPVRYRSVISVLKNPFYAGAYAYGKSEKRTALVDGHVRRSYGHGKPPEQWEVMLHDHHEGYIDWAEFERNQKQLAVNAYGKVGGAKSGRGGRALLAGVLSCGQCGRRLRVAYTGRAPGRAVYRCDQPNLQLGQPRCMSFAGLRVDMAVAQELVRAVEPMAVEAALQAQRKYMQAQGEQLRIAELELQQARYEATLSERRYATCDPENRLIAAQLEKNWEAALQRVKLCEQRLKEVINPTADAVQPDFDRLAEDLEAAWNAPGVTMRARQQLLRALITDIVADVNEKASEVTLTIHWRGGQHSQLKIPKLSTGEHGRRTSQEALAVIRSMAGRWSDEQIAASLNRMAIPTGQGNTWNARRVGSLRTAHGIHAYRPAEKDGQWLTMSQAAARLGVTNHRIRRLIKDHILEAEQVVPGAPFQIRASDLSNERVIAAIARTGRPCRVDSENQTSIFPTT